MVFSAHSSPPNFEGDAQFGNLRKGEVPTGHAGIRGSIRRGAQLPMARTRMQRAQNRIRTISRRESQRELTECAGVPGVCNAEQSDDLFSVEFRAETP